MLHDFITTNRTELIVRCRAEASKRPTTNVTPLELEHGIPRFLDQLVTMLRYEQSSALSLGGSGKEGGEIGLTAKLHGRELSQQGFTIDEVVHSYGDVCQAISGLAIETRAPIEIEEFKTLNRCLDNAIAEAVTEFAQHHDT